MAREQAQDILVISDDAGNYYMIRSETLEAGKVADDQRAMVERVLRSGDVASMGRTSPDYTTGEPSRRYEVRSVFALRLAPTASQLKIRDALRNM